MLHLLGWCGVVLAILLGAACELGITYWGVTRLDPLPVGIFIVLGGAMGSIFGFAYLAFRISVWAGI